MINVPLGEEQNNELDTSLVENFSTKLEIDPVLDVQSQFKLQLNNLNVLHSQIFDDGNVDDFTDRYNTKLTSQNENSYLSWRDSNQIINENDYDYRGLFQETQGAQLSGQLDPRFRKPNHKRFTTDSIYDKIDGYAGGTFTADGKYIVGETNLHSGESLIQEFQNTPYQLVDKRGISDQTFGLQQALRDDDYDYSYVLSDMEAYQKAQQMGDKGYGEVIKEAFDPSGTNAAFRTIGTVGGAYIGGALALGAASLLTGGAALPLLGAFLIGGAGAMIGGASGDQAAIWFSESDERDIEEKLLKLEAGTYATDEEREAAEMSVADWYNKSNIEKYRQNGGIGVTAVDMFLENLPYIASFAAPGGATVRGTMGLTGVGGKTLKLAETLRLKPNRPGFRQELDRIAKSKDGLSPFRITKEQAIKILEDADTQYTPKSRGKAEFLKTAMKNQFEANAKNFLKSKRGRLAIGGLALGTQQPQVFKDLRQEELESVTFNEATGEFEFDETNMTDLARREAQAALAVLVETVGFEYASKLIKATRIQKGISTAVAKVADTSIAKVIGGSTVSKRVDKFFKEDSVGMALAGRGKFFKEFRNTTQIGGVLEEASEEYIEMVASSILDLEKDNREERGMTYAEGIVDSILFPVKYPDQAAAILISVGILPAGVGVVNKLRGNKLGTEFEKELETINNYIKFQRGGTAELKDLADAFDETEGVVNSIFQFGKNKKWYQKGIVGAILKPGRQQDYLINRGLGIRNVQELVDQVDKRSAELQENETVDETQPDGTVKKVPMPQAIADKKAIKEIVSQSIVVRFADTKESAKALDELIVSGDLKPFALLKGKKEIAGVQLKETDRGQFVTQAFTIDAKRRAELIEKRPELKEVLESQTIVETSSSINELDQSVIDSKSELDISSLKKLADQIRRSPGKNFKEKKAQAIKEFKDQINKRGGIISPTTSKQKGKDLIRLTDKRLDNLVNSILNELVNNPDLKISYANSTLLIADSDINAGGRKIVKDGAAIIQARNLNNEILIGGVSAFASDEDNLLEGARVIEEEALEINYQNKNLTKKENKFVTQAINRFKIRASNIIEGTISGNVDQAKEILNYLDNTSGFEAFIAITQGLYGEQSRAANNTVLNLIDILTESDLKIMDKAVLASYSGKTKDNLKNKMDTFKSEKASDELDEQQSKGKKAVEKFLEEQPDTPAKKLKRQSRKVKKAKEEATKVVEQQIKSGVLTVEQEELAKKVLDILNKEYENETLTFGKIKAVIRRIHTTNPNISYSMTSFDGTSDGQLLLDIFSDDMTNQQKLRELAEDLTESLNSDMEFDSDHAEIYYFKNEIALEIIKRKGNKNGRRIIRDISFTNWFKTAISSEEAWKDFLNTEQTNSTAILLRDIGNGIKTTATGERVDTKERMTYKSILKFDKSNKSLHTYRFFKLFKDKDGNLEKMGVSNSVDLLKEIIANSTESDDNPITRDEYNNILLEIIAKDKIDEVDISQIFKIVEQYTGVSSDLLVDINDKNDNLIVKTMLLIKSEDLKNPKKTRVIRDAILDGARESVGKKGDRNFREQSFGRANSITRAIMESDLGILKNSPMFTNVEGSQKSAVRGDSHFDNLFNQLFKDFGFTKEQAEKMRFRFIQFLDGFEYDKDTGQFGYDDMVETINFVFKESARGALSDSAGMPVYLHHMGRFGEKSATPFIIQKLYGTVNQSTGEVIIDKEGIRKAALRAKDIINKLASNDAKNLYPDPVKLVDKILSQSTISQKDIIDMHYAVNTPALMQAMHGDISAYMLSEKKAQGKTADQLVAYNYLNIVARTSQVLTDGEAYQGSLNVIRVPEIASIADEGSDAFDGLAVFTQSKLDDIQDERLLDENDNIKGHISNTDGNQRNLVKVNWHSLELLAETIPEMKEILDYVNAHNSKEENANNQIEAVVFESGAKYSIIPETNYKKNEAAKIVTYDKGNNLIISVDLHHDNSTDHVGAIPSQRMAHFAALNLPFSPIVNKIKNKDGEEEIVIVNYDNAGSKAAELRRQAAEQRLAKPRKDFKPGSFSSPQMQRSANNGEDIVNDTRFASEILKSLLSNVKELSKHIGQRISTQTIGEGSIGLPGYNVVETANGQQVVKLARLNANIRGGRYATKTNKNGNPFKEKEDAIDFIKTYKRFYADMFWVKEDGTPDFKNVMEHELDQDSKGNWIIPGEIIDRTRVPSGSYASHSFNRLNEPVSTKFVNSNIAIPNDGIRIGMGEDLDGDKGFSLVLHRTIDDNVPAGIYRKNKETGELEIDPKGKNFNLKFTFSKKNDENTLQNRALLLEHMAWINPDAFDLYNEQGEIPKDAFDEAIDRTSDPILTKLRLGTVEGIGHATEINYIRNKVIGIMAVYNSMYSALSVNTSEDGIINIGLDEASFEFEDINGNKILLQSPHQIQLASYRSVKKVLDTVLNIALDDHKDPRLFFANLNRDTASMFASLVMSNITATDLSNENSEFYSTQVAKRTRDIITFIKSDFVTINQRMKEMLKEDPYIYFSQKQERDVEITNPLSLKSGEYNKLYFKALKELQKENKITNKKISHDKNLMKEHQAFFKNIEDFTKNAFNVTAFLKASMQTPTDVSKLISLLESHLDGFGLFNYTAVIKDNPLFTSAKSTIQEYLDVFSNTIEAKLIKRLAEKSAEEAQGTPGDILEKYVGNTEYQSNIINILIAVKSLYKKSNSTKTFSSWLKEQNALVTKIAEGKTRSKNNKLVKNIIYDEDRGLFSLSSRLKEKDFNEEEIEYQRNNFEALPIEEKIALATVSYIQFGLGSSNWNGNWSPFFSNQFSKFINEGMPLAINSYINLTDLSKNLEALQDAVSLGSTYKIKVDFVAIFPSFDRFDKELVDEAQTELDLEPPTIDERVKDLIEQEVSKTEIKKQDLESLVKESKRFGGKIKSMPVIQQTNLARNIQIQKRKGAETVVINYSQIAREYQNNRTDGFEFNNITRYSEYLLEKAKLIFNGMSDADAKAAAYKNINPLSDRIDEDITYSMISLDRIKDPSAVAFAEEQIKELEEMGLDVEEIFLRTGLYRWGPNGKIRYELDDSKANFKLKVTAPGKIGRFKSILRPLEEKISSVTKLELILNHPTLFKIYPELKDLIVRPTKSYGFNPFDQPLGQYDRGTHLAPAEIRLNFSRVSKDENGKNILIPATEEELLSTLMHEIQHAIQDISGFTELGSNIHSERIKLIRRLSRQRDEIEHKAMKLSAISELEERSYYEMINSPETKELARGKMYEMILTTLDKSEIDRYNEIDAIIKNLYEREDTYTRNKYIEDMLYSKYRGDFGEIEAKIVEKRLKLSPRAKRKITPFDTAVQTFREEKLIPEDGTMQDILNIGSTLPDYNQMIESEVESKDMTYSISVDKDLTLGLTDHMSFNKDFANVQVLPPNLIKALAKNGIEIPPEGTRIHFNSILDAFIDQHKGNKFSSTKSPIPKAYKNDMIKQTAESVQNVLKDLPNLGDLPGNIQSQIVINYNNINKNILRQINNGTYNLAIESILEIQNKTNLPADKLAQVIVQGLKKGKSFDQFLFHRSSARMSIVYDGLGAGGVTPFAPIDDYGYGDMVYVFNRSDLPSDSDGGDVSLNNVVLQPVAVFHMSALGDEVVEKYYYDYGNRAQEGGDGPQPYFPFGEDFTKKMQEESDTFNYIIDINIEMGRNPNATLKKLELDKLLDLLVEYNAFKQSIDNVSNDKAPSVLLQTQRVAKGISELEAREYILSNNIDEELDSYNLSMSDIMGTPGNQYKTIDRIESAEDFALLGQIKKVIRLVNGVPTKFQLTNKTVEEVKEPTEISYSFATFDKVLETSSLLNNMSPAYGSQEMQRALLKATREGKVLINLGRAARTVLLMETGSANYMDPKDLEANKKIMDERKKTGKYKPVKKVKTIKKTRDSNKRGIELRKAFTLFLEHYKDPNVDWRKVRILEVDQAKEKERLAEQERTGQVVKRNPSDAIGRTVGEIFTEWEFWREENAPHLIDVSDTDALYEKLNKIFGDQYDALESISGYIGELWFAKRSNYVPHEYEPLEKEKKFTQFEKETARQEKARKYNTYLDAFLTKGLVPKNLDLAALLDNYSVEVSKVVRNRIGVSAMAQVSDEDMLPMMLIDGIERMGVMTEQSAHVIANRLEKAISFIKPEHKFTTPKNINGFKRLNDLTGELKGDLNPKKLGYEVVDTGFASLGVAYVKKGDPVKLMGHIFADQREFKTRFRSKAYNALLSLNHIAKSMSISLSLFHPFALVESLIALDGITGLEKRGVFKGNLIFNPIRTYKDIMAEYRATILNPEYSREWVEAGMGFDTGRSPDIDYAMVHEGFINKANKMIQSKNLISKGFGHGMRTVANLKWQSDRLLWEVMLPGMKLYAANRLFSVELARRTDVYGDIIDEKKLREEISEYLNDAFGGQEWEKYMWANPRMRKHLHLLMFAPDWTLSALNVAGVTHIDSLNKAIGSPTSELHARNRMTRYWGAFGGIVLIGIPNVMQALIYGLAKATGNDDEDDEMFSFNNEKGHKLHIDMTPLWRTMGIYEHIGKTRRRRTYMAFGKQAFEVFGPKGWLRNPVDTALGKSSIGAKIAMEQMFGIIKPGWQVPWADTPFLESWFAANGNIYDGRASFIVRKFIPLSLQTLIDAKGDPSRAKPLSFFAPMKLGKSGFAAKKEIAEVMDAYVKDGFKANIKGLVKEEPFLQNLVSDIVQAAEINGYDPREVFKGGVSMARARYYKDFYLALEEGDEKGMAKNALYLQKLKTSFQDLKRSVEGRLEDSGRKLDIEKKIKLNTAWAKAWKRATQ